MTSKQCFKCLCEKPLSEFYKHSRMADGHLNKCKDCTKQDIHAHRHGPGREKVLAYDRERAKQLHSGSRNTLIAERRTPNYGTH